MADDEEPVNKLTKKSPAENTPFHGLPTEILLKIFGSFDEEPANTLIRVYGVNSCSIIKDSIKVEVNANTMEIVTGKWELEEHLSRTGVNLSDYTVDSLITSGVLYKSFERRINQNTKGNRKLEEATAVTYRNGTAGSLASTSSSKTDGGQQQQQVTENRIVAMYKHVDEEGLAFTVDPKTKKLTSKPSLRLREFLKNAGPSTTVAQLITIGVFVKFCDCIMEVKKVEKVEKSVNISELPLLLEDAEDALGILISSNCLS